MEATAQEKLTLNTDRAPVFFASLFFGFCLMVFYSELSRQLPLLPTNYSKVAFYVAGSCFCLFILVIGAIAALSPHMKLRLSREGFRFGYALKSLKYRWSDVGRVWDSRLHSRHAVGFDFSSSYLLDAEARSKNGDNKIVCRLLPNTYGLPVNGLKTLLSEWRDRYGALGEV